MRHEEYKTIYRRDASRRKHFARLERGGICKRVLATFAVVVLVMAITVFKRAMERQPSAGRNSRILQLILLSSGLCNVRDWSKMTGLFCCFFPNVFL